MISGFGRDPVGTSEEPWLKPPSLLSGHNSRIPRGCKGQLRGPLPVTLGALEAHRRARTSDPNGPRADMHFELSSFQAPGAQTKVGGDLREH